MRFTASATSAPVDLAALINALPALANRWRALRFDGGTLVMDDGSSNAGLTVEAGAHPLPGTRYRLVMPDRRPPTPSPRAAVIWLVALRDDDAKHIRIRVHDLDDHGRADVEVTRPNRPETIEVTWVGESKGSWLTRGSVTVRAHADLSTLTTGARPHQLLRVDVRHRHGRAKVRIQVDTSSSTRWTTSLDARVRGAGALRPVVALASPLVRRVAARHLEKAAHEFPAKIDELNREMVSRFGSPASPERIAEGVLDEFLHDLVVEAQ